MKKVKHFLKVSTLVLCAELVALIAATVHAGDTLNPGDMLSRGEYLKSRNHAYTLIMQQDGNLVLYDARKHPLWTSNTQGQRVQKCSMQTDGNLVLYLDNGQPVWASGTVGKPGSFLVLQNDGNLVIYQPQPVWASDTNRGPGPREERHDPREGPHDRSDHDSGEDRGRW